MMDKNFLAHLNTATVITWAVYVFLAVLAIWTCAYVARVASEFGRGIFLVLVVMLAVGLYLGPWFFSVVHAVGLH